MLNAISTDAEFGKEFLISWKLLSEAQDDAMHFSFDSFGLARQDKEIQL